MRDNVELGHRVAEAKQALLLGLKNANGALLDGSADEHDLQALATALEQTRRARDALDVLYKRLLFHHEMDKITLGSASDDTSRTMINLVRLGVDGGYDVAEVRRLVDSALGR